MCRITVVQTYISAFGEGWGLYAEYLGLETGFYQDPLQQFRSFDL